MVKKTTIFLWVLILGFQLNGGAQQNERSIIQFSGVVLTGDSLTPVSFTNILIKNTRRGTISDYYGYFSFVAQVKDTIEFSAIGFKRVIFVVPDSLTSNRYSLIQIMHNDTVFLKETVIYPWPSKEQFKEAFMKLHIPDDDFERAKKNLARADMKERFEAMGMDGSMNYRNYIQQQTARLYYAGQLPPQNILNPIAWAKFIEAWRNGDFKRKRKDKD